MQKKIFIVATIIFILTGAIYLIIPSELDKTISIISNCNNNTANRIINDDVYRKLFWPPNPEFNIYEFKNDGTTFKYSKENFNASVIKIYRDNLAINSGITISSINDNQVLILWNYSISTGKYPWEIINSWMASISLERSITNILTNLKNNCEDTNRVYGKKIVVTTLRDSTLIAIKSKSISYPSTDEIYALILLLKNYAKSNNAKLTNCPMLNIMKLNEMYLYMVALPVNKELKPFNNIETKRMLANGRFLETEEIVGGYKAVSIMEKQFEDYKSDFAFSSPAIPFQSLITDRMIEKDTSKWITKLYYPIF